MKRLLAGLAIILALGLVACGGDTEAKNDYVEAVNKAQTDFATSISKAPTGANASDPGSVFDKMAASVDKVVADLKAVEPPDAVQEQHDRLVSELEKFGAAIEDAGESLASRDPQKIASAQAEFAQKASDVGTKIGTAIQQINSELQE